MNFDECMKAAINDSVVNPLERMKTLDPESRSQLFLEFGESIFSDINWDDELIVPFRKD